MDRFFKIVRVTAWMWILVAGQAMAQTRNHAFTVDLSSATVCLDGATFVGEPTQASSLNLLMTAQVFDAAGTSLLATGNSHMFTNVGEQFTFVVLYEVGTFNAGDSAGLSVSDIPGTISGVEGFFDPAPVADCLLPTVPVTPSWALAALLVLLAASGVALSRRFRSNA